MRLDIDLTQGKNSSKIFFTSDLHLFHNNVLRFDNRPFNDVHHMHAEIEKRWNDVVDDNDIVIFLGDLSFAKSCERDYVYGIMHSLNGKIHFVLGNHDKREEIVKMDRFETVSDYLEVRIKEMLPNQSGTLAKTETLFCCMHYPIHTWNKKHHGSYMIHGHSHMSIVGFEKEWEDEFNKFIKYIPSLEKDNFSRLINQKKYYSNRVFDVGCMGCGYAPISHLEIIKNGADRIFGVHH